MKWKLAAVLTVVSHYILFILLVGSIPYLFLFEPWYVSVPLVVWLINLMTLPVRCPLTTLENYFRVKAEWPKISGFVSKWILFRNK